MAGLTTSGAYDGTNAATDFNRGIRNEYYLNLAKQAALKVINESEAELVKPFSALFAANSINNNAESLFHLQWHLRRSRWMCQYDGAFFRLVYNGCRY